MLTSGVLAELPVLKQIYNDLCTEMLKDLQKKYVALIQVKRLGFLSC